MELEMFLGTIMIHERPLELGVPTHRKMLMMIENNDREHSSQLTTWAENYGEAPKNKKKRIEEIEKNRDRSDIIDGQQRLTVLTILCRILKDLDDVFDSDTLDLLEEFYMHINGRRIQHNTTPDKEDYHRIIDDHTSWQEAIAVAKEKLGLVEEAKTNLSVAEVALANAEGEDQEEAQRDVDAKKTLLQDSEKVAEKAKENAIISWDDYGDRVTNFMEGCYDTILEWVKEKKDSPNFLAEYIKWMFDNVKVSIIKIEEEKQVHLVFKSLNALGKLLSSGELVKNDLFHMAVSTGQMDEVRKFWRDIMTTLRPLRKGDKDIVAKFLWIYLRSKGIVTPPTRETKKLKQTDVYAVFDGEGGLYDTDCRSKDTSGDLVPNGTKLLAFTKELRNYAFGYATLMQPHKLAELDLDDEWMNEITDIRGIMPDQTTPYLLAAFMKTVGTNQGVLMGPIPAIIPHRSEFYNFIKCLSVPVVRLVCTKKLTTNKLEDDIQEWINQINNKSHANAFSGIKGKVQERLEEVCPTGETVGIGRWRTAMNKKFKQQLTDLILHTGHNAETSRAKYLVRGCEGVDNWSTTRRLQQKFHNTKEYTAEHILPFGGLQKFSQGVGPWWNEHLAHGTWNDPAGLLAEAKDVYDNRRSRLGNFLLIESKLNKSAGTRNWSGKAFQGALIPKAVGIASRPSVHDDGNPRARAAWGKYHIYAHGPWKDGDEQVEPWGSHLLSVKKFCSEYGSKDHWNVTLLDERTKRLARKASWRRQWRFW